MWFSHRSPRGLCDINAALFGIKKRHHIDRRYIHPLGQTARVSEHPVLSMAKGIDQSFPFGASLFPMHMEHLVAVEIASDPMRGLTGKLFRCLDATMKRDGFGRASFLDGLLKRQKMGDPSRPHQISLNQRDAVLTRKVADHVLVDERNDDFITADDALLRGTRKRECMGAPTIDVWKRGYIEVR